MTTTLTTTPITTPIETPIETTAPRTDVSTRPIWRAGGASGVVAAASTSALAAATGPLEVAGEQIPVYAFAQLTLIAVLIGTFLATRLARRARSPRRTFVVTTLALTAASLVPDVLADASTGTRLALMATHLVAAAIVIPALAARLSD